MTNVGTSSYEYDNLLLPAIFAAVGEELNYSPTIFRHLRLDRMFQNKTEWYGVYQTLALFLGNIRTIFKVIYFTTKKVVPSVVA